MKDQPQNKHPASRSSAPPFPTDFVVVDTETTGFSPDRNVLLEIAALKVVDGTVVDTLSVLVKAGNDVVVPAQITRLTGITQKMIDDASPITEAVLKAHEFIGDMTVIGHNVNFDIGFLDHAFRECLQIPFGNSSIDTMRISRRLHPEEAHHRLSDVANRYGIRQETEHRALADCETTLKCYYAMLSEAESVSGSLDGLIAKSTRNSETGRTLDAPGKPSDAPLAEVTQSLGMTDDEKYIASHFISLLGSSYPKSSLRIERRSANYLSLFFGDYDIVRFKATPRARWISIDSWNAGIQDDDPRFIEHKNKSERHWKASLRSIGSISDYDDLVTEACEKLGSGKSENTGENENRRRIGSINISIHLGQDGSIVPEITNGDREDAEIEQASEVRVTEVPKAALTEPAKPKKRRHRFLRYTFLFFGVICVIGAVSGTSVEALVAGAVLIFIGTRIGRKPKEEKADK